MSPFAHNAVAVTGMGCVCAAGSNSKSVWESLVHGTSARSSALILHPDAMDYPFFAAPDSAFAKGRLYSAADTLQLALFAAENAVHEAALSSEDTASMGIVMGTTAGSALHFLQGYAEKRAEEQTAQTETTTANTENTGDNTLQSGFAASPEDAAAYFCSNIALVAAQKFKTSGVALTVANACTSGADAIGLGADMIRQGQCDVVLCGGADALSLVPHTGFARLMIYSNEACRPFDAHRQGLNLGEGAGMIVLESIAHAKARNAKILGYVAGYGASADAHHFTAPHPEARGLHAAVQSALNNAALNEQDIALINAHGTATRENDKVEGNYFTRHFPHVPVWASKGVTGHTLGAAGALEAIFCLLALQHGTAPRSFGFSEPSEDAALLTPTTDMTALHARSAQNGQGHIYALSTSLGFGGGNAALILANNGEGK